MTAIWRGCILAIGLLGFWQAIVWLTDVPHFILPGPGRVVETLWVRADLILGHAVTTSIQIVLGLIFGTALGGATALTMAAAKPVKRWMMPVLVASQAVPVFALAPLLVLWLGFGMESKVAMAVLIIFFPVTAAFYDGLRRVDPGWVDMAQTMGASPLAILWHIRLPAALPAFGSGLRVATAVAPIGAVVGEWVGSSSGLGYLMLQSSGRMQTDTMFAALFVLAVIAISLYALIDRLVQWMTYWQPRDGIT